MFKGPTKYSEYIQDVPKSIDYILKRVNAVTVADLQAVTNAGATTTLPINTGGITSDYFQLDTAATPTLAPGMFGWDDAYGTADLRLKGNNVTLQLGQELLARVVNKTGADLLESQYKVVRVRIASEGGAQGQRLAVVLAQGDNDPDSATTLGIVTEDIPNNQEGFITIFGNVNNINTTGSLQGETWVDGDVLYLSPTTPGAITKVKPVAPQHTVIIGYVVYAHNNQGKIFVKVDNGYELDELHNVLITSPANNDLLQYDSTQQVWKNVAASVAVPTPTLAQVTTAGNTTTNAITVGSVNSNGNVVIGGAASSGAFQSYNGFYAFSFGTNVSAYNPNNNYTRIHMGASITYTDNFSGNFLWRSAGASVFEINNATINFWNTSSTIVTKHNASTGNFLIGTTTDAGYKLDVNGTARTSQLHTFLQGTYLNALSTNYFYTADTGGSTYGGLALKNSTQDYSALIYTGRSGASNSIVFEHLTYSGTPTAQGSQKFSLTGTTFGVGNNSAYGHTLTIHQRSGGVATYPLVITNQINTTNSGVGILMQTADSTSAVIVNHASIVSWKQNLTSPNVTSDMRFSTISDGANTLSEKMRISSAGNLLVGTTTDSTAKLTVGGSITAASALAQGVYFNNTLVAAANNDVLVGLDIKPTFANGAFTGVQNYAARLINSAGVNVLFATGVNNSGTHKITFSNAGVTTNSFISSTASGTFSNMNLVLGQAFFNGSTVNTTNNIVIQSNSSTVFEPRTAISYAYLTGDAYVVTAVNNTNAVLGFSNGSNATSTRGAAIFAIAGGSFASTARLDFAISNVNAPVVTTADVAMSLFNSKNFAIGTTTDAGYKLDVNGTSRFTQAVVVNAGGVKTESGTITAQTGVNSGRMTMFNLRNTGGGFQSAVGTSLAISFTNREVAGVWSDDVIENIVYSNTAGSVTTGYNFYTHNNQAYNASPVLAMSINGLNVGIGTSTPTDKFHIVDNTNGNKFARISAGGTDASAAWVAQNDQVDNVVYRVFGSAVSGTQMGISLARSASLLANLGGSGKFLVGTFSSTDFVMGTGNQERMRLIDSTGNFLVGTTTDLGNKLEVSGTINATAYKVNNTAGYTGIFNVPTNPPGQQNIDIQGGIVVNIF